MKQTRLQITAHVYHDRHLVAKLSLESSKRTFDLSAEAAPESGAANPPTGNYRCIKLSAVPDEQKERYGTHIALFQALAGMAMQSPANHEGKFIIALHGGDTDTMGHLFRTEGGLRVSNADMQEIVDAIADSRETVLLIEESHTPVSALLGKKVSKQALTTISVPVPAAAMDEKAEDDMDRSSGSDNALLDIMEFQALEHLFVSENETEKKGSDGPIEFGGGSTDGGGAGGSYADKDDENDTPAEGSMSEKDADEEQADEDIPGDEEEEEDEDDDDK